VFGLGWMPAMLAAMGSCVALCQGELLVALWSAVIAILAALATIGYMTATAFQYVLNLVFGQPS